MASSYGSDRGERTLAQWYCLLVGLTLLLVGVLGFLVDSSFDTGTGVEGDELIAFEVNGWHNLVHIASGLLLLPAAAKRASAKTVATLFGLVYGLVTIIGMIDGNDVLGIIPVNGADNILHLALAGLGLATGLMSPGRDDNAGATGGGKTGRFDRSTTSQPSGREHVGTR